MKPNDPTVWTVARMTKGTVTAKLNRMIAAFYAAKPKSIVGAGNAWRGYWLQALYVGGRVVGCDENTIFLPETVEDLMVVSDGGTEQESVELVQVKSLQKGALSLSHLNPKDKNTSLDEDDSFFGHIHALWKQGFNVRARVVVFGDIGPEIAEIGERLNETGPLWRKMVNDHGYPEAFCKWISEHLAIERADETALEDLLIQSFGRRVETAAAASLARENVMSFIYSCCRQRTKIDGNLWEKVIADFGVQASSARGYLENFGHTIVPLPEYLAGSSRDITELEASYRAGVSTIPEHIALGLDIERPKWQTKIDQAFKSSGIVVVRAPSGQGKTSLCYRWLMDRDLLSKVYLLNGVSRENASGVAAALRGLADQPGEIFAYIEAGPHEGWVELCEEIYRLNKSGLNLLISVREDDAARSGFDASKTGAKEIYLRLTRSEASEMYERFDSPLFPSFESAWRAFGGDGPLMEFVYSLNNKTTLRQKLEGQVKQLRMTECEDCLTFLYLASEIGAYGLPSSIVKLKEASDLHDVQRILAILEHEMLLRSDMDRELVFPLHPYRSKLLAEIIAPMLYGSEEELVLAAATCACGDYGPILIPYLSEHSFSQKGLSELVQIAKKSWTSSVWALRVMVWKDARRFYLSTAGLRGEIAKMGLPVSSFCMLAGLITERSYSEYWNGVLGLFPDTAAREATSSLISELANLKADYQETDRLLSELAKSLPPIDLVPHQASDAGFVLAYIGERGLEYLIPEAEMRLLSRIDDLDSSGIDGALDFFVGLNCIGIQVDDELHWNALSEVCQRDGIVWLDSSELVARQVVEKAGEPIEDFPPACLDSSGMVRQVSAIIAPRLDNEAASPPDTGLCPNDIVMRAICDLRRLFPNRGRYCVRFSGIKTLVGGLEIPDCEKKIPEKNIQLNWMKLINQYYLGMCSLEDGFVENWDELERILRNTVADSVSALDVCSHYMDAVLSGSKKVAQALKGQFESKVARAKEELDNIKADLPLCARDPFAFTSSQIDAFATDNDIPSMGREMVLPAFGLARNDDSILRNTKAFLLSLQTHFNNMNSLLLHAIGRTECPQPAAVTNIAQACAKLDECSLEFSSLFGGDSLVKEKQKKCLFEHAVYCNYLWCRTSTKQEKTFFRQAPRATALLEVPNRLVKRLEQDEGVESVCLTDDGMIRVTYLANANSPFSEVAMRCIQEVLKFDLSSREHLVEDWILRNETAGNINVTFTSGGNGLVECTYRISTLVNYRGDSSKVEALSPGKVLFDENNLDCFEKAAISFVSTLNMGERLRKCVAEVGEDVAVKEADGSTEAAYTREEWRKTATKELDRLSKRLDNIVKLYPELIPAT